MSTQPFARRQLGRLLRDLRKQARVSTEEACRRLEVSSSRLSRIETGQSAPDIHIARSMLDLYEVGGNDWERILEQVRQAKEKSWWQALGLPVLGYVATEAGACAVRDFSIALVPGLLQTEDYMRAVLASAPLRRTAQQFENQVEARLRRQARLVDDDPPLELGAIIDEGALRRQVAGIGAMRAQLRRIVEIAALRNVTAQVMPLGIGSYWGLMGSLTLLTFPDPDDPDMVYIEHISGSLRVEKPDEVRRATLMFDQFRADALSPDESIRMIERIAAEL